MLYAKFVEESSLISTLDYSEDPEKYRGLIICPECNEKAWFTRGFSTEKRERMACFGAHHQESCNASTVLVKLNDADDIDEEEQDANSTDIRVDLDKSKGQSIYVSRDNDKHGNEESDWLSSPNKQTVLGPNGYPLNKSLRQLLTHLSSNSDYTEKDQSITIVADSGRKVLDGMLNDYLIHMTDISTEDIAQTRIYWGTINNLNQGKNGEIWLNYGSYSEPSILVDEKFKNELIRNFKLKDITELEGADVIIVSHASKSQSGKFIIHTNFTKYMSFRRYKVMEKMSKVQLK